MVDCTGTTPLVLRAGVVTVEDLRSAWPNLEVAAPDDRRRAHSPGTRYRHYAPRARIRLVEHPDDADPGENTAYLGLDAPDDSDAFGLVSVCQDLDAYAHELYAFFRRCDDAGIETIYCQQVAPTGLGLALMDRLRRAEQSSS